MSSISSASLNTAKCGTLKKIGLYSTGLLFLATGKVAAMVGCLATGGVCGILVPIHLESKLFGKASTGFWSKSLKNKFIYFNRAGLKATTPFSKYGEKLINSEDVAKKNAKIDSRVGKVSSAIGMGIGAGLACTVGTVIVVGGMLAIGTFMVAANSQPRHRRCHHYHYH